MIDTWFSWNSSSRSCLGTSAPYLLGPWELGGGGMDQLLMGCGPGEDSNLRKLVGKGWGQPQ